MDSKDFITDKLRKLVKKFPSLKVSYSFHILSDTHSIEILPKNVYNTDLFKQFEESLIIKFITKYPFESICFLTEDSIISFDEGERRHFYQVE